MPSRYIFGNITWYSLLIVMGMALAIILATKEERRKALPKDTIIDISIAIIPAGIIGARLYYVLFNLNYFLQRPLDIIKIWNGGLAIYGGIIFGALASYLLCKRKKVSFFAVADCIAPGLALAQSIGRWGNFFNQEAYGRVVVDSGLQFFPYSVYIQSKGYFMATFFYESICDFFIFIYLWNNRKNIVKDGDLFFRYLALYGCIRVFVEGLRSDSLYIGNIRVSQALSALLIICVALYFLYRLISNNQVKNIFKQKSFYLSITSIFLSALLLIMNKFDFYLITMLIGVAIGLETIYNVLKENNI